MQMYTIRSFSLCHWCIYKNRGAFSGHVVEIIGIAIHFKLILLINLYLVKKNKRVETVTLMRLRRIYKTRILLLISLYISFSLHFGAFLRVISIHKFHSF